MSFLNSLTAQAIALMALCFAIGSLAAWLLAVALYPSLRDVRPAAHAGGDRDEDEFAEGGELER